MKKAIKVVSATAKFYIITLVLLWATIFCDRFACVDMKRACLQNGPKKRSTYSLAPTKLRLPGYILWRRLKLPRDITEVGRLWANEIMGWSFASVPLSLYSV